MRSILVCAVLVFFAGWVHAVPVKTKYAYHYEVIPSPKTEKRLETEKESLVHLKEASKIDTQSADSIKQFTGYGNHEVGSDHYDVDDEYEDDDYGYGNKQENKGESTLPKVDKTGKSEYQKKHAIRYEKRIDRQREVTQEVEHHPRLIKMVSHKKYNDEKSYGVQNRPFNHYGNFQVPLAKNGLVNYFDQHDVKYGNDYGYGDHDKYDSYGDDDDDYYEKHEDKYDDTYEVNNYNDKYDDGYDEYEDKYDDGYEEKYASKYGTNYADKYNDKYDDKVDGKFEDKYDSEDDTYDDYGRSKQYNKYDAYDRYSKLRNAHADKYEGEHYKYDHPHRHGKLQRGYGKRDRYDEHDDGVVEDDDDHYSYGKVYRKNYGSYDDEDKEDRYPERYGRLHRRSARRTRSYDHDDHKYEYDDDDDDDDDDDRYSRRTRRHHHKY